MIVRVYVVSCARVCLFGGFVLFCSCSFFSYFHRFSTFSSKHTHSTVQHSTDTHIEWLEHTVDVIASFQRALFSPNSAKPTHKYMHILFDTPTHRFAFTNQKIYMYTYTQFKFLWPRKLVISLGRFSTKRCSSKRKLILRACLANAFSCTSNNYPTSCSAFCATQILRENPISTKKHKNKEFI